MQIPGPHVHHTTVKPVSAAALGIYLFLAVGMALGQSLNVVDSFTGGLDGANPTAALTGDRAGHFYGTTSYGYQTSGSVFRLTRAGAGWVLNPLYGFRGGANGDGAYPFGPVTLGPDGALYGTTSAGGLGFGTVYRLSPPATPCKNVVCGWNETVLYSFTGGADGNRPIAGVTFDPAGTLYGTTQFGGLPGCDSGNSCGVVYKLTHSGGTWSESVIYSFTGGADGYFPIAGVILDQAGNLYGTADEGGIYQTGAVFELSPSGSGWTERTLYAFQGGSDGGLPWAGLTFDAQGNLFGATTAWGNERGGTIFELSPVGGNWIFTLIYTFDGSSGGPRSSLVFDGAGNLYGAAYVINGGLGTTFRLSPGNSGWTFTDLHDFSGGGDGGYAWGGVTLDTQGNVFGTTLEGGIYGHGCYGGCGVIYEITP